MRASPLRAKAAGEAGAPAPARHPGRLRRASAGMMFMLIVQFALGMSYNLYGTMPTARTSLSMVSGGPVLILHEIMGLFLVIGAVQLVVQALRAGQRAAGGAAVAGLLAILGAAGGGMAFLGHGADGASMTMAMTTAVAMACYTVILTISWVSGMTGERPGKIR